MAADLGISHQTFYTWRRQDRIDPRLHAGLSTAERTELTAARQRICDLETEGALHRAPLSWLKDRANPKRQFTAAKVMVAEGLSVEVACRVLGGRSRLLRVAIPGAVGQRLRHSLLTEVIRKVHTDTQAARTVEGRGPVRVAPRRPLLRTTVLRDGAH